MKSWEQIVEEIALAQSPEEMGKIIGGIIMERDNIVEAARNVVKSLSISLAEKGYALVDAQNLITLTNLIGEK